MQRCDFLYDRETEAGAVLAVCYEWIKQRVEVLFRYTGAVVFYMKCEKAVLCDGGTGNSRMFRQSGFGCVKQQIGDGLLQLDTVGRD